MKKLLEAARFAAHRHAGQKRRDSEGTPYINHPIEVCEHLASVGGVTDEDILVAALLHDTIEDTDTTEDEIRARFGERVLSLVLECTDDKRLEDDERKRAQVLTAPFKSPGAKMIKISDKASNLRSVIASPPKNWSPERRRKYSEWAASVIDGLKGVNAALDRDIEEVVAECRRALLEDG